MLSVGDKVVYPYQGPCEIGAVVKKVIGGRATTFYRLVILENSRGKLFVPIDKAGSLGLRKLIKRSEISQLLTHLHSTAPVTANWKQRAIDNMKLLCSGSPVDLAQVIESLTHLGDTKALSPRDRETLERARRNLIREISEVTGESRGTAEAQVDQALNMPQTNARPVSGAKSITLAGEQV